MHLQAEKLRNDPRVKEAKELLLKAIKEHSANIKGVRSPNKALEEETKELLDEFSRLRGGALFYPYIGSGIGNGAFVELIDGSVKYDFITGIGVHGFGHSNLEVCDCLIDAALSDTVMQGNLQQNSDALELSRLFTSASGLPHCFLSSTGVMANENALKIAFQKNCPATRVLAFDKCFMGRTLAISQITDKPSYRVGIPLNQQVDYIPFYDDADPEGSTKRASETLEKFIARYPNQYAAMIFELIQGEAGFRVGSKKFFRTLMEILKKHGILSIIDEVQSFGRTSKLFAFQHFELDDLVDIVTVGKISQACATLFRSDLIPKPGLLTQTFTASTSAIKASIFVLKQFMDKGFSARTTEIQQRFAENFERLALKYPGKISGPWGIGGMVVFTPYEGTSEQALNFSRDLFKEGVMSFVAGTDPMRIRFLVPTLVLKDEDIDNACMLIEKVLCKCE